jgi:hypothetical protein
MINDRELTLVLLVMGLGSTLIGLLLLRYRRLTLRPIPAYIVLPEVAADAVESNYPVHFSMGSSALGGTSTISALASAEVIYRLAERLAVGQQTPLITLSDALTVSLAQDTLRRAYEFRRNMADYRSRAAAWFPQGQRSLAFAAGAAGLIADANIAHSVLLGRFGVELALLGEGALRHDQVLIAHSDTVEGQAVAFAQANQILIGEELYVGPAYLNGQRLDLSGILTLDVLRWAVILGILIAALQAAL